MTLKVIGAGFFRCGTKSLKDALEVLGFGKCWHGLDCLQEPAILDKFMDEVKGETVDYDTMFDADVQAVVDVAGVLFYKELFAANPDAKVVLSIRDENDWYNSVKEAIFIPSQRDNWLWWLGERAKLLPWLVYTHIFKDRFEDKEHTLAIYREHIECVKREIPSDKLLFYRVSDGWEPLCNFLGVPVPSMSFPVTNSRKEMVAKLNELHS